MPSIGVPGSSITTVPDGASWPEQTVVAGACPQGVDLETRAGFALVPHSPGGESSWVLQRIDLDRATTESGPTFPVGTLVVASGYLWISCGRVLANNLLGPTLCQVDPRTLAAVNQVRLPPLRTPPPYGYVMSVSPGPPGSVWVGYDRTLARIATGTGVVETSIAIPSGTVDSVAVDPDRRVLYVSLADPTVSGKTVTASVLEFDVRTGRALAGTAADSPVTSSAGAGALTAVPGGVWTSFRTGMAGVTILLRQSDLSMIGPPSTEMDVPFPDGVFGWMMEASTVYGGGALLLVNENGVMACVDPGTGAIRVRQHLSDADWGNLRFLAVDAASGRVLVTDGVDLESISPPQSCWR